MAIAELPGIQVGHWTDFEHRTGCTVLLCGEEGATCGVAVGGGAPGTRETDALDPGRSVERVHAVCLSGGSAFGLATADGVLQHLAGLGIGLQVRSARVPIVPAAVIFDLAAGAEHAPGADAGRAACAAAAGGAPVLEGRVGAGAGATVGKLLGREHCRPGGVGVASLRLPGEVTVAALAVVNALGDVVDERGEVVAGCGGWEAVLEGRVPPPDLRANTTLAVVVTDAALDKTGCRRLAEIAQDGLALALRPAHTAGDGDCVFALSTGRRTLDPLTLGVGATEVVRRAIVRGARAGATGG
ncbi:MAG: P1 family peptidase [Candidatus Dormibacteraceae bacterium]